MVYDFAILQLQAFMLRLGFRVPIMAHDRRYLADRGLALSTYQATQLFLSQPRSKYL